MLKDDYPSRFIQNKAGKYIRSMNYLNGQKMEDRWFILKRSNGSALLIPVNDKPANCEAKSNGTM